MAKTKLLFCVIGSPIKHSLSPKVHNAWFWQKKISARYSAIEVRPHNLASFMKKFRSTFRGANVTIPHKESVMKFLDEISPEARSIGAVNTIVNKNGRLIGYNTDAFGALAAVKTKLKILTGRNAIVLGAGGAARAIVWTLTNAGMKVTIANRTYSKAKKLAKEFRAAAISIEKITLKKCALIVNATSVGMGTKYVPVSPLPNLRELVKSPTKKASTLRLPHLRPVVMDIIYRPHITKLLRDAKTAGCKIITGDQMFLSQAKKSFEYFIAYSNSREDRF